MKALVLRSCVILLITVIASGAFFEWVLLELIPQPRDPSQALDEAFLISLFFDILLVLAGALALSWPLYRRILRLQRVVEDQQKGDLEARANFEGKDAIAQLAHNFDRLADINREHIEHQRALLRAVSHELRTPVARLRFNIAALEKASKAQRSAIRERTDTDIDELDTLIEEILAYSRVTTGSVPRQLEHFDLCAVLRRLATTYPDGNLHVHAPKSLWIEGEPRLIHRAISNLVRNAVHYAKKKVEITLQTNDHIEVRVRDDGPGLPQDADHRLFLPFVRYDSQGVGLGTSIALAIAKRHGGNVNFTPRPPGDGAEFVMQLPLSLQLPETASG